MSSPISASSLLQAFGLGGASNIDVNSIVTQLLQVDAQPLVDLQKQVQDYQTKISAYGTLLSSVTPLSTAVTAMQNSVVGMSATPSNSTYFTATALNNAATGTTPVQISNIATAQSIYSTRYGSATSSVADLSVDAGSQNLQIQVGSNTKTIAVTSANNTLSGIASAINTANIGVTATVVTESSNFLVQDTTASPATLQNNTINFTYNGTSYTATLTAGNYTATAMATEIARAMNAAGAGSVFAVDYGTTSANKFTIKNTGGAAAQINWANAGTKATPQQFGFEPGVQSPAITAAGLTSFDQVNGTYKLALTTTSSGTANRITMKVDEAGGVAYGDTDMFGLSALAFNPTYDSNPTSPTYGNTTGGTTNMVQSQKGIDAKFSVNGVMMYRSSNTVTDAITGVTLNLLQAETTPGASNLSVTVGTSSSTLSSNLSSFVTAYNSAMQTINGLYNPVTSQTTAAQQQAGQGYLNGDSELLALKTALSGVATTAYGTTSNPLNNNLVYLGITTDKNGVMSFNSSTLSSVYTTANASAITAMINNFANQLGSTLSSVINVGIPGEQQSVQQQITSAQNQEASIQQRLQYEQNSLITEYTALANYVAGASSISSYLTTETGLLTKKS